MSLEQLPEESATPELPPDQPPTDTAPATPRTNRTPAILTACAILALPLCYLAYCRAGAPKAASAPPAAASTNIASLEAAVRNNPTADNRINLSLAYINANTPGSAIPVLQAVIAADPNNLIAWNNLCVANTQVQDYKTALDDCQRAVQIDPTCCD